MRTRTVTGTLADVHGTPVAGATITATLQGATDIYFTADSTLISALPVETTTASDGTWSLALVAPGDLTPSGLQYQITSSTGFLLFTTSFVYSGTPASAASLSSSAPTPSSTTTMIYDYLIDPSGTPIGGAPVTCRVSENAVNPGNNTSIQANAQLTTVSDSNGYYQFNVVPSTVLTPTGVYYLVYENGAARAKTIQVGSSGGLVNALVITPTVPGAAAISQATVGADQVEAATFDTLTSSSTLINTLNRIRWVLAQYTGAAWSTATLFAQLNPVAAQAGNLNITGSVTAAAGLTTGGVLSVGGNATVSGNLTVNGSIGGAAIPNVGTIPPGAIAVYTTPHGRQNFLGSLGGLL